MCEFMFGDELTHRNAAGWILQKLITSQSNLPWGSVSALLKHNLNVTVHS